MERFRNILLYANSKADNSTALRSAASLASENGAKLKIVDVIKEASHYPPTLPSINNLNIHDIIHDERRKELDRLAFPYEESGIKISAKVLSGIPFIEVIREIIKKEHDLLITTPQGSSGLSETLFGTTTMHLMRKCPCPVWAIKPSSKTGFDRIMAAVDFDPAHEENQALNTKIIELASSLAEFQDAELYVVHAWRLYGENLLRNRSGLRPNEIDKIVERSLETHRRWLNDLVQKNAPTIPEHRIHLLKGEAGDLIPETAIKIKVDLIVMGTVGRTGIPGYFIGNTAERILQQVNCSVMAVKPDRFVSPVESE